MTDPDIAETLRRIEAKLDAAGEKLDSCIADIRLVFHEVRNHRARLAQLESLPPPQPSNGEAAE